MRKLLLMPFFQLTLGAMALSFMMLGSGAHAGNLEFTGGWNVVNDIGMSERRAANVVNRCSRVQAFANGPKTRRAAVVAGPHKYAGDKNMHLTVRLYDGNKHKASCHVYIDTKSNYKSCNCED